MSPANPPGRPRGQHQPRPAAGKNTVNQSLTPKSGRPVVELAGSRGPTSGSQDRNGAEIGVTANARVSQIGLV